MKNIALLCLVIAAYSCSGNSEKTTATDSMNAIEDHPLQDTTGGKLPNGYAPPNTEIDTSAGLRDSINKAAQH